MSDLRAALEALLDAIERHNEANIHGWSVAVRQALASDPVAVPEVGATGSVCVCGLAKSYHPRLTPPDHEYEPRYPVAVPEVEADELTQDVLALPERRYYSESEQRSLSWVSREAVLDYIREAAIRDTAPALDAVLDVGQTAENLTRWMMGEGLVKVNRWMTVGWRESMFDEGVALWSAALREYAAALDTERPHCPAGCGCRLWLDADGHSDADRRDCACDGPCCWNSWDEFIADVVAHPAEYAALSESHP